jgi:hypothetical protein
LRKVLWVQANSFFGRSRVFTKIRSGNNKITKKRAKDADGTRIIKITSDRTFLSRRDIRQPGAILQRNKTIGEEFWEKNSVSADVP